MFNLRSVTCIKRFKTAIITYLCEQNERAYQLCFLENELQRNESSSPVALSTNRIFLGVVLYRSQDRYFSDNMRTTHFSDNIRNIHTIFQLAYTILHTLHVLKMQLP